MYILQTTLFLSGLSYINSLPHYPCHSLEDNSNCIENTYSCGLINNLGQGTVVQCINGINILIDNCNDLNTNVCKLIDNVPYCVQ